MPISIITDEFGPDFERTCQFAAQEQIPFIDLRGIFGKNIGNTTTDQQTRIKDILKKYQLQVACIASPLFQIPFKIERSFLDARFKELDHFLNICTTFAAPTLRIFSFKCPKGWTENRTIPTEMIKFYQEVGNHCAQKNVIAVLENELTLYGDSPKHMIELVTQVSRANIKLLLDHGNLFRHRDPYDFSLLTDIHRNAGQWVGFIHVKDVKKNLFGRSHCIIGQGFLPFPQYFNKMRMGGYNGIYSVETHIHAKKLEKKWQNSVACYAGLKDALIKAGYT
jgi:sugar phosphate isomerase/epimerase